MASRSIDLPRRRFTVEDYHRMAETGILTERDRVELIEGEIASPSKVLSYHRRCGGDPMKGFTIELPGELLEILGSEDEARRDAKVAVVLDLVRRGRISRAKAAELLELTLWDLPALLSQYRIPWFDYTPDDVERDLTALREAERLDA